MQIQFVGPKGIVVEPIEYVSTDNGAAIEATFVLLEAIYTALLVNGAPVVGVAPKWRSGEVTVKFAPRIALLSEA